MKNKIIPSNKEDLLYYRQESHKSHMFFTGLIFATLSYIITNPVDSNSCMIFLDRASWILLFLSGLILLTKICDFSLIEDLAEAKKIEDFLNKFPKWIFNFSILVINKIGLKLKSRTFFWKLYVVGMLSMLIARMF